jgi:hypothetical protein
MTEKSSAILSGKVENIISSSFPTQPEKAQIRVEVADRRYREIRIDSTLKNENGNDIRLTPGAHVEVTIEADAKDTTREK